MMSDTTCTGIETVPDYCLTQPQVTIGQESCCLPYAGFFSPTNSLQYILMNFYRPSTLVRIRIDVERQTKALGTYNTLPTHTP